MLIFKKRWISSMLWITLAGASLLEAQTAGTGTLVGTVTDSSGALVVGAKVVVINPASICAMLSQFVLARSHALTSKCSSAVSPRQSR